MHQQFYIPATASLQERRPRILKHNDTFGLFDHNGDILTGPASPEGIFHRDTRHLSRLNVLLNDAPPLLLSSTIRNDNAMLRCDLTNSDVYENGELILEHDLIHLRRSKFIWNDACFERLVIRNYANHDQTISLAIDFEADFADIFEVRGSQRELRGTMHPPELGIDSVILAYSGRDNRRRHTTLRFFPTPSRLSSSRASFDLSLKSQAWSVIFIEIACNGTTTSRNAGYNFFSAFRRARTRARRVALRAAEVRTSDGSFNEAVRQSCADLSMLVTDLPEGGYPYAGIPWFSTIFGRDGLICALETLWMDPSIARGVLGYLAKNQACTQDDLTEAEPGKILHEVRQGEMAELGEVPFRRYYGSVDATPLFVMLAGAYLDRTGDLSFLRGIWPNIAAALGWIDTYGDLDGDGFIEYARKTPKGLLNQGWKDSNDSVFHADGSLAEGPIALIEVQAYVYGARRAAAEIARQLGLDPRISRESERKASELRKSVDATFWVDDLQSYALALDGAKRTCRVSTSNAGYALYTGIAFEDRAAPLVRKLTGSDFFSGWGIRTVGCSARRYNPMSYHNGSVWPHDNALIAEGFARYGFSAAATKIFEGLFAASTHIDLRRLPELFCGFARQRHQGPTFYPVACSPQAWSAAVPLSLLRSCLGLQLSLEKREIIFRRPRLPSFLDEVTLRGLPFGGMRADLRARRNGGGVDIELLANQNDVGIDLRVE